MEHFDNTNTQFLDVKINCKDDFFKALDILHDGMVKEQEITYDAINKTLDILIERADLEDKNAIEMKRVFPFIKKYSYPVIKSHLHLFNLASFSKDSRGSSLQLHTFNEGRSKNNKYFLLFCEVLKIELSFLNNKLSGFMRDEEILKDKRITFFSFSWKP